MKHLLIILISLLTLTACSSKKGILELETLPKDISQKPHAHDSQEDEQMVMKNLIKEIDSLSSSDTCTDPADWKFAAIGSKSCGGPSSYIVYPTKLENEILSKVTQFTSLQVAFNTKYKIMSDCAIVLPPAEIKCEDGKAVLISDHSEKKEAE